ncbi:ABC transporter permease [Pedobacter sp. KR3-3]|uniref:ABC transporter permease n=1 Tax=Pedobacter albus TaxID=3113905 RepID=A0ABU7I5R3_9SPHI|nr:ABC transporter permease [Pedobacter sp. KR3-3]MEE1944810.1 ABC transporter permease [Pedobacter sp. KR3-3]
MFKLNFKIALRNLWKNKAYTAINIFGLAAGLAGFVIILLYIAKETSYDKWDPALKRTYIVAADFTKNGAENKGTKIKGLLAKVIREQISEAEVVSMGNMTGRFDIKFEREGKTINELLPSASIDSSFFSLYPLKAIHGRMEDVYTDKDAIAISATAAQKLFGTADPINQVVVQNRGVNFPPGKLVVKAVWDDRRQASVFGLDLLYQEDFKQYGNQLLSTPFTTLFRLKENVDQQQALKKINDAYIVELGKYIAQNSDANYKPSQQEALKILKDKEGITSIKLITEPIASLNLSNFYSTNAKQTTIYILFALASFLIIISCINYTNLALVMAQARAKEVGVKKVLGAFRWSLIKQFFTETAIQCSIAFLLALIFAELLLPQVNRLLADNLELFKSFDVWLILGQALLILMVIMLLAGAYPAFILAGFRPVKVLKGNFSTATHIGNLRRVLVVVQFTIAIALVISFGVIFAQLNFIKQKDLGLKSDQLLSFRIAKYTNRVLPPAHFESIKNRLLAIKGVEDVTRSTEQPINDSGFEDNVSYNNTKISAESRYVDPNYLTVLGAKLAQGRNFSYQLLGTDSLQSIIVNETAFRKLGLDKINAQVAIEGDDEAKKFNVVGVVKDIQVYGFDQPIMPTIYLVSDYALHWRTNVIVRLSTRDLAQTTSAITELWKEIEPGAEIKPVFVDEVFAKMNHSYEVSEKIIFFFGMVTFLISVFGLIGFAAYTAKIRLKEIAVRRILGASTTSLLQLLNKDFVKLVLIASVLADVLAYIYMKKWFAGFAYRIDMPYLVFILVNAAIVLLTVLTVSIQSLKAVKSKPVDALKYE